MNVAATLAESNSPAFDFTKDDRYLQHLTTLGETQSICAAEDICNERGVLLVKKGSTLSREMTARLQGLRLNKALDEVTLLERAMKPDDVLAAYADLFQRYSDFNAVHQAHRFDGALRQLVLGKMLPYILLQRLTILKNEMPEEFDHALFCGWFAALMADELRVSSQNVYDSFVAGLFHDIGILHVDEASAKPSDHIWIGRQLLQRTGIFNTDVLNAVLEHHERCDGTGWPQARTQSQLGLIGQIIAVCDTMYSVRHLEYPDGNLGDCLPYLKINAYAHFYRTFQAVCAILKRGNLHGSASRDDIDSEHLRNDIAQRTGGMQRVVTELVSLSDCLSNQVDATRRRQLEEMIAKLLHVVRASGLVSDGLLSALSAMRPEENGPNADELIEVDELQLELLWLMQRALRNMRDLFESEAARFPHVGDELKRQLNTMQEVMDGIWRVYHARVRRSEQVALRSF